MTPTAICRPIQTDPGQRGHYKANDIDQAIAVSNNSALHARKRHDQADRCGQGNQRLRYGRGNPLHQFAQQLQRPGAERQQLLLDQPGRLYDGTVGATTTQGISVASSASGAVDITTVAGGLQAVSAVGPVQQLGVATEPPSPWPPKPVGLRHRSGQLENTNYSAAESDIRDANVATEAADLTKAQACSRLRLLLWPKPIRRLRRFCRC